MVSESQFVNLDSAPIQLFQLSKMVAVEKLALKKNLKVGLANVRIATKRIEAEHGERSCRFELQAPLSGDGDYTTGVVKGKHKKNELYKIRDNISYDVKPLAADKTQVKSSVGYNYKRGPQMQLEGQKVKKQRMDGCMMRQCAVILKNLMTHPAGWVFNQPVDPVALNIPDYFSIISKPMDLGTIKSKMEKKLYLDAKEFEADVRLTFSNAMLYNPPDNNVHKMAKELNNLFNQRWKSWEAKLSEETKKRGGGEFLYGKQNKTTLSSEYKKKIIKESDDCVWGSSQKDCNKGTSTFNSNKRACGSTNIKPTISQSTCVTSVYSEDASIRSHKNDAARVSSSDLSSERSLCRDRPASHDGTFDLDHLENDKTTAHISKSDPDSDGAVSAVDEENAFLGLQCATSVKAFTSGEGWMNLSFDGKLSPTKALRAAKLKSRFAETILKAQQKTRLDHVNPLKIQQEKERLERKQREETERIEAEIRAVEVASRLRVEAELKARDREREAARIALQKMKKTVDIDENQPLLRALEVFGGDSLTDHVLDLNSNDEFEAVLGALERGRLGNALEQLGLHRKDDDMGEEDDEEGWSSDNSLNGDMEEGEIGS